MKFIIPKSIRSKAQILKTVNSIPLDFSSDEYFQLYTSLFKKIHPSNRRIFFYEIFCEKLKLSEYHNTTIQKVILFHQNYLCILKTNKEKYKELKKEQKAKKLQEEKASKNLVKIKKALQKQILSSNVKPITTTEVENQNHSFKKRIQKSQNKKIAPIPIKKIIYTGMTN